MKLIHTSDWHLGRKLHNHQRYQEFERFLHWIGNYIEQNAIDVLLIAGDIFDSNTPSNRAQTLYYQFLHRMAATTCQHIVIIAGNHDSPSLLNAPKEILKFLNVHVVAYINHEQLEDEVLSLRNADGEIELIVCAVPYLRDRDIRQSEAGESFEDKESKLKQGIQQHYQQVVSIAQKIQARCENNTPPIIAMGHLFTAGGKTQEGDGVRDLYVGSLAHISLTAFPDNIDYLALGHLHIPQRLAKSNIHRYSGSPLPMSFGEATQQKMIIQIDFNQPEPVQEIKLPCFQKLVAIKGDITHIETQLAALKKIQESHWLEISYTGKTIISDLRQQINTLIEDSQLELLRLEDRRIITQALRAHDSQKTLDELQPNDVFQRCLEAHEIDKTQYAELQESFNVILRNLYENDSHAE
ncbi:MAG TPA: exonuclease subunit SbcD [Thiothrix sp.]|nr:exonuclease subunit SbcD [Thiothrix sp.]